MFLEAAAQCDKKLGLKSEVCYVIQEQEALLLLKTGDFVASLDSMPSFLYEATNELSPKRQIDANVMALRVLAANGRAAEGSQLRSRLSRVADSASDSERSERGRLSARLALAEADLRDGDGIAAEKVLAPLFAGPSNAGLEGGYMARALMLRGLALQAQARDGEALSYLRAAQTDYADSFGPSHPETLLCGMNQIRSLVAIGDRTRAISLLDSTLPTLRGQLPPRAPVIGTLEKMRADIDVPSTGTSRTAGVAVFFN